MPYLRRRRPFRRYSVEDNTPTVKTQPVTIDTIKEIPLPNEAEVPPKTEQNEESPRGFLGFLKGNLLIDEIILVGLIFLLLDEGVEDEFLLILLVYILLTGRE